MNTTTLRLKVIDEIQHIPEGKLQEIYNVIHLLRVGVESTENVSHDNIMSFAGCWDDMSDDMFNSFLLETAERRSNAFSGRTHGETLVN